MTSLEKNPVNERLSEFKPDDVECHAVSISKTRIANNGENALIENQDKFLAVPEKRTLAVFDGVGGYENGSIAAAEARKVIQDNLENIPDSIPNTETEKTGLQNRVKQIFSRAHDSIIRALNGEQGATTAAFVKIVKVGGKEQALVAHTGDSRVYRYNPKTGLEPITLDDAANKYSSLDEQTALGNVSYDPDKKLDQDNPTVARVNNYLKNRNTITSALGGRYQGVHVKLTDVEAGDMLITMTDGVTDNLTEIEIRTIVANTPRQDIARALAQRAYYGAHLEAYESNRSKSDDITAGVMEVGVNPESYSDVAGYIGKKYPEFFENPQAVKSFREYINTEENDSTTRAEAARELIAACKGNEEQLAEISSYAERLHARRLELLAHNDPFGGETDGVTGLRDMADRLKLLGPTLIPVKRDKWRGHEIVDLSMFAQIVEQIQSEPDFERINTLVAKLPSQFRIREVATLIAKDVTSDRRMSNFSSEQTKPNINRIF